MQTTMPMRCSDTIRYAEHIYYDKKRDWNKIVERAMMKDFSWKNSAKQYEDLYEEPVGRIDIKTKHKVTRQKIT